MLSNASFFGFQGSNVATQTMNGRDICRNVRRRFSIQHSLLQFSVVLCSGYAIVNERVSQQLIDDSLIIEDE